MSIDDVNGNLHSESDGRFTEKTGTRPGGSLAAAAVEHRVARRTKQSDAQLEYRADTVRAERSETVDIHQRVLRKIRLQSAVLAAIRVRQMFPEAAYLTLTERADEPGDEGYFLEGVYGADGFALAEEGDRSESFDKVEEALSEDGCLYDLPTEWDGSDRQFAFLTDTTTSRRGPLTTRFNVETALGVDPEFVAPVWP